MSEDINEYMNFFKNQTLKEKQSIIYEQLQILTGLTNNMCKELNIQNDPILNREILDLKKDNYTEDDFAEAIIVYNKKLYLSKLSDSYVLKKPSNMYEIKIQYLDTLIDKLNKEISIIIDNNKLRLSKDKSSYILNNPSMLYKFKKQNLDNLINKLEVLNPMNTLKRGYAIIKKDNTVVSDINNINIDDTINIKLNNGNIISKVMEVNNGK